MIQISANVPFSAPLQTPSPIMLQGLYEILQDFLNPLTSREVPKTWLQGGANYSGVEPERQNIITVVR